MANYFNLELLTSSFERYMEYGSTRDFYPATYYLDDISIPIENRSDARANDWIEEIGQLKQLYGQENYIEFFPRLKELNRQSDCTATLKLAPKIDPFLSGDFT